jgi:hypothetical protein
MGYGIIGNESSNWLLVTIFEKPNLTITYKSRTKRKTFLAEMLQY